MAYRCPECRKTHSSKKELVRHFIKRWECKITAKAEYLGAVFVEDETYNHLFSIEEKN